MDKVKDSIIESINLEENNKSKGNNNLLIILSVIIIIILLLGIVASTYLTQKETKITGKASGPITGQKVEIGNSYLFASPLKAKAGGGEKIRITIFILDAQGRGVAGKKVSLGLDERMDIGEIQPNTDDLGKAIFDISSKESGLFIIEASVENKYIPQRVNISFE